MMAIGAAMFVIGMLGANLFGERANKAFNRADYIFGAIALFGTGMFFAGAFIFMWRELP